MGQFRDLGSYGLGLRVEDLGFRFCGSVWGSGFKVEGLGSMGRFGDQAFRG